MKEISDEHNGANVIAVLPVPETQVDRFGVIAGEEIAGDVWKVSALCEKPAPEEAPSNLAVFGRYLLSPHVMELLAEVKPGAGGEIQLTDALDEVLKEEEMYALIINEEDGFDTGTVESWLDTNNRLFTRLKKDVYKRPAQAYVCSLSPEWSYDPIAAQRSVRSARNESRVYPSS